MYADENENYLPGPAWTAATASYDKNASQELIWFLASQLSYPEPSTVPAGKPVIVDVFVCPGYARNAPDLGSMAGRKCYFLNDNVGPDPTPANYVHPFGYPIGSITPLMVADLDKYGSPSSLFAVTDIDLLILNYINPKPFYYDTVPVKPVHGQVRNRLYFDSHAEAERVDW